MSWGEVAFDADLAASVLWDLVGAPALYAGDVELGKSAGGHGVMIAAKNRTGYAGASCSGFGSIVPNASAGVAQLSTRRGRWLSFAAMTLSSSRVNVDRSAFLCRDWRSSRFVFSFVPRCQGWCGAQKNTGIDSAVVITAWRAISPPRAPVNERRRCVGRHPLCGINARATTSGLVPSFPRN